MKYRFTLRDGTQREVYLDGRVGLYVKNVILV